MKFLALALLPLAACAPSLVDDEDLGTDTEADIGEPADPVDAVAETLEDGSWLLLIDATHEVHPVKIDLDTRFTTLGDEWEMSLVRYDTLVNADIGVIALEGVPFEDVVDYDDSAWVTGDDASSLLAGWWDYNLETHEVSPADITFLFQTDLGEVYKLRFEDYYADAGTPATVSLHVDLVIKDDVAAE